MRHLLSKQEKYTRHSEVTIKGQITLFTKTRKLHES